jgi:hypothetical protein
MRSVASDPVGAPFAMSTEGAEERSLRAPPTPSSTQRPIDGSTALQESNADISVRGRVHVVPPSKDLISTIEPAPGDPAANWLTKT